MPIEKNLQEILDVLVDGFTAIGTELKDGFQFPDLLKLFPIFTQIPEAIKDADHALNYLKDMTPEKESEVIAAIIAKIPNATVKTKAMVTYILRTLANAYMSFLVIQEAASENSGEKGTDTKTA